MLTTRQVQWIYAQARACGVPNDGTHDDDLHAMVAAAIGREGQDVSIKSLTVSEYQAVREDFAVRFPAAAHQRRTQRRPSYEAPPGKMTYKQGKMAFGLAYDIIQLEHLDAVPSVLLAGIVDKIFGYTVNFSTQNPWRMISVEEGRQLIEHLKQRAKYGTANYGRRRRG